MSTRNAVVPIPLIPECGRSCTIVFVSLPLSVVDTIAWVPLIHNIEYFLVPRVQWQDPISKVIFFMEYNTHFTALTRLIWRFGDSDFMRLYFHTKVFLLRSPPLLSTLCVQVLWLGTWYLELAASLRNTLTLTAACLTLVIKTFFPWARESLAQGPDWITDKAAKLVGGRSRVSWLQLTVADSSWLANSGWL